MKTPTSVKIAKIISLAGHPFVLLPLTVLIAAASREPFGRALRMVGVTALVTVVPLLLIIRRKVRAGSWSDHDVSDAVQRRNFYPIAIVVAALSLVVFYLLDFPRPMMTGLGIGLLLLTVAMLINRRSKISLHLMFAAYFAVSLLAVSLSTGAIFFAAAAAIGWSRIRLERHTSVQVASGAALGAAAGLMLLKFTGFF